MTMHRALLMLAITTACSRSDRAVASDAASAVDEMAVSTVADSASAVVLTRSAGVVGGAGGRSKAVATMAPAPARASEPNEPVLAQQIAPGSMLVRVGQASLQVDSLDAGIARVRDVARRTGAIVANTSMEGGRDETRAASLQLRIPSDRFDEAVNALSPIGKLESVNVKVQDVGEEYVDVQARVANARRLEQRLVDLLATRTGKLSDVLAVERELARVREEIERNEGRMRYLQSRASVSTLTIAVHEPYPMVAAHAGARPIHDAVVQAWRNLVGFTAGFIELLGVLVPLGALVTVVVLVMRRVVPARMPRLASARANPDRGGA